MTFHWITLKPHYLLTLVNMHGDADAFTSHTQIIEFNHDSLNQAIKIVDALSNNVLRDDSTEDVASRVAKKVDIDEGTVLKFIEPFIRCDAKYGETCATPVCYTLSMNDPQGKIQKAQWKNNDQMVFYKPLTYIHPFHLERFNY